MVGMAAIIAVINAFYCLTVYADGLARMRNRACKAVAASLVKTFTTCIVAVTGMLSAHHNVTLTAAAVFVIGTI
jgi:hypothetical protein